MNAILLKNLRAYKLLNKSLWLLAIASFGPIITMLLLPQQVMNARNFAGTSILLVIFGCAAAALISLAVKFGSRGEWGKCICHHTHSQSSGVAILASMGGFSYAVVSICCVIEIGLML